MTKKGFFSENNGGSTFNTDHETDEIIDKSELPYPDGKPSGFTDEVVRFQVDGADNLNAVEEPESKE